MIELKNKPFNLNDDQINWVNETLSSMTLEQKCGQLFCALGLDDNEFYLRHLINDIGIGGMMYRSGPAAYIQETHRKIQSYAKIPL
ncbi:MAG: glycoside hydrolase family 3 protein, partial [Clostridia bacterium]|nr:glycoside hydrolase family 3 protein [Clostridia bacterium]